MYERKKKWHESNGKHHQIKDKGEQRTTDHKDTKMTQELGIFFILHLYCQREVRRYFIYGIRMKAKS